MTHQIIYRSRKVITDLVQRHADEEKNHDCVKWKLENYSSLIAKKENFQSPKFTVGTADECIWYFNFQPLYRGSAEDNKSIIITCHLILDNDSDCKEAFVKIKFLISAGNEQKAHGCKDRLSLGQTFKFITKSEIENKAGISPMVFTKVTQNVLNVECEIEIQKVVPETDNLSKNLGSLLKNQLFTDVVLSVGGKNYPAHKTILAARSPVFAAMFTHDMIEKEGPVCISDIDENVLEEMLHYVYTGKLTLKSKYFAKKLLAAADKYDMKDLLTKCEEILDENLSCSNALDVIVFAKLLNRKELKSRIVDFILDNKMKIMSTEAWKTFHQSDPELLQEICEASFRSKN